MLTLTSKDNSNIKNTVKLKKSARYRRRSGLFIAEGLRVCYDAMLSNAEIEILHMKMLKMLSNYQEIRL